MLVASLQLPWTRAETRAIKLVVATHPRCRLRQRLLAIVSKNSVRAGGCAAVPVVWLCLLHCAVFDNRRRTFHDLCDVLRESSDAEASELIASLHFRSDELGRDMETRRAMLSEFWASRRGVVDFQPQGGAAQQSSKYQGVLAILQGKAGPPSCLAFWLRRRWLLQRTHNFVCLQHTAGLLSGKDESARTILDEPSKRNRLGIVCIHSTENLLIEPKAAEVTHDCRTDVVSHVKS